MADPEYLDQDDNEFLPSEHPQSLRLNEASCYLEEGYRFFYVIGAILGALLLTLIIAAATAPAVVSMEPHPPPDMDVPRVILISVDAFAWKYLNATLNGGAYSFPHIQSLLAEGWAAPLQPVFPSKTFPNHYSIVTGLYSESHGIVSNTMYDPVYDQTFTMATGASLPSWWGGEPLWVTAERQNMTAGCMFWPGSDAAIDGVRPSHYLKYNGDFPYEDRVELLLGWLQLPQTRPAGAPQFMTLYFEMVDHNGHSYGPDDADKIQEAFNEVDEAIGQLLEGLERLGLHDMVNIVLVSDHGMAATSPARTVDLNALQLSNVHFVESGTITGLWPSNRSESYDDFVARLEPQISGQLQHATLYRHDTLPERWHWANNRRVAPLTVVADAGWWLLTTSSSTSSVTLGSHGYDNTDPDMQGVIIASGPAFRDDGAILPPIANVNIYAAITSILGLEPAPNNGTLDAFHDAFHDAVDDD